MENLNWIELLVGGFIGMGFSLAVNVFLTPVFQEGSEKIIIKIFGKLPFPRNRNLTGLWYQKWKVKSQNFPEENESILHIDQLGNKFSTKFISSGTTYHLLGRIERDFISGTWYSGRRGGYHGTFQLFIHRNERTLSGKWIGFGSDNKIKEGEWNWVRKTDDDLRLIP